MGFSFCIKKDGRQRMVLDARQTNSFHKAPPFAAMASPGVMAGMLVDDAWDGRVDFNPANLVSGSVNLCDGFTSLDANEWAVGLA